MRTKKDIQSQINKVKAASLGELVLFTGPNLLNKAYTLTLGHVKFQANLGIYKGFSDKFSARVVGGKAYCAMQSEYNIELAIAKASDIPPQINLKSSTDNRIVLDKYGLLALIISCPNTNLMWLDRDETLAYVGPKEISKILKQEGNGLLDEFFQNMSKNFVTYKIKK